MERDNTPQGQSPRQFHRHSPRNGMALWVMIGLMAFMGYTTTWSPVALADQDRAAEIAGAWSWRAWAMVDADSLNIRSDASPTATIVDRVTAGTWIEVIGNDYNGFSPINREGEIGWVATEYLSWDGEFRHASRAPGSEHWIQVNGATGQVDLMAGTSIIATYWGSVGFDLSPDGFFATADGVYTVYEMRRSLSYTAWADAYVTDWVGFDPARFNGFHSYTKDANGNILPGGDGETGGCVALPDDAIDAIFDWSFIGMRVVVYR